MAKYNLAQVEREMAKSGVAWLRFDEPSGNVTDSKGTAVGAVTGTTRVAGVNGNAISFNGISDYVQFASKFIPLGKKSIRFKIKCSTNTIPETGNITVIVGDAQGTPGHGNNIYINVDGSICWASYKAVSGQFRFHLISTINICDNQWHDVLCTWDGTTNTGTAKLYIDDMTTPHVVATANIAETVTQQYNVTVGKSASGNMYYFNGQLDELEIYNNVIDTSPIYISKHLISTNDGNVYSIKKK